MEMTHQLHALVALPRETTPTPVAYESEWATGPDWMQCREKSVALTRIEPKFVDYLPHSLVALLTELSRLQKAHITASLSVWYRVFNE
jgi:hypothetical protein